MGFFCLNIYFILVFLVVFQLLVEGFSLGFLFFSFSVQYCLFRLEIFMQKYMSQMRYTYRVFGFMNMLRLRGVCRSFFEWVVLFFGFKYVFVFTMRSRSFVSLLSCRINICGQFLFRVGVGVYFILIVYSLDFIFLVRDVLGFRCSQVFSNVFFILLDYWIIGLFIECFIYRRQSF